jgi:hypothetical protein
MPPSQKSVEHPSVVPTHCENSSISSWQALPESSQLGCRLPT